MDLTALNSTVIFSYPKTLRKTSQRLKTKIKTKTTPYPYRLRSVATSTSITENNKNSYSVNSVTDSNTLSNAYPYIAEQQQKQNELPDDDVSEEEASSEYEISANTGTCSSDNLESWESRLRELLHSNDKQELVSREKRDRRDYEQIADLASKLGLHSRLYVRVVVVSKVPLPNYRYDLDDKRPQREVTLPPGLQRAVDAHLEKYLSQKTKSTDGSRDSLSPATVTNGSSVINEGSCEQREPTQQDKAALDKALWRRSMQLHMEQQVWQKSSEGQKMLESRRSLPTYKEKDAILNAISKNQVVIISGETGCGKTTQIPQFILESEVNSLRGATCNIICTQPRRISAMSVSERIATERGEKLGETDKAALDKALWRRSMQLHMEQQAWQKSSEGQKMLESRRSLPTYKEKDAILNAISKNQVVIISGETGCGKTTQIPQFILESEVNFLRGATCNIICTQPRRISAMSVSERIATERGEKLGETVGYKVRLEGVKGRNTRLVFYTTGILLRRLLVDRHLKGVTHVIMDEIHERGIDEDFLLTVLKEMLPHRPELRLVLMSATLNAELFSSYFGGAPVIQIPGVTHPVRTYFLENILESTGYKLTADNQIDDYGQVWKSNKQALNKRKSKIASAVEEALGSADFSEYSQQTQDSMACWKPDCFNFNLIEHILCNICENEKPGGILVFMTGWDDISSLKDKLQAHSVLGDESRVLLLTCHSSMASSEQRLIFEKPDTGVRKIVLATNIAETSITIDDLVFVIDCGKAKEASYDALNNAPCLLPSWISKVSAKQVSSFSTQRRGRAGRVQPGECYHLYPRCVYDAFAEYQLPQILRTPLQSLCLQIKSLNLGSISEFLSKALQSPDLRAVQNAIEYLKLIGALDENENLTALGRYLTMLPMEPKLGKMLVMGTLLNCLDPILTVVAGLSIRDPFLTPLEKKELAEAAKAQYSHDFSDHLALVRAYKGWKVAEQKRKGYEYCWKNFLSVQSMKAIDSLRREFKSVLRDIRLVDNKMTNYNTYSYDDHVIRAVICYGLYPNVCSIAANFQHKETSLSLKTMEDGEVSLHSNTVNARVAKIPYPWLVFNEKIKVNSVYLRDSTAVSDSMLLLFGGSISAGDVDGHLKMLEGYLEFFMAPEVALMYQTLKRELDELFQSKVGYKVRLEGVKGRNTRLVFYTTGILLRRLLVDRHLKGVTHVIMDEIHERGIDEDFLLTVLKEMLPHRPELRLVLMSATLNAELFSSYFGGAPVIQIPGVTHPVRTYFLENILESTGYKLTADNQIDDYGQVWKSNKQALNKRKSKIASAVEEALGSADFSEYSQQTQDSMACWKPDCFNFNLIEHILCNICENEKPGGILVFMTGWDDISSLKDKLQAHSVLGDESRVLLLTCHSSMASSEQRLIFEKPDTGVRKIVLATNIAETSITIDDLVFVIDCGKAKEASYDALNNAPCLLPSWISKVSAKQRRGRAGRVQPGECYHLYPRCVYDAFAEYQLPQILRTPLQSLCLQIKSLNLGSISEFLSKALQSPDLRAVQNAIEYLKLIGALDENENLTALGRYLTMLPMEPKLGKMLVMGTLLNCLDPILTVVAGLSIRDPFLTPLEKKELAEAAKAQYSHDFSDHLALVRAYKGWKVAEQKRKGYEYCWKNFLSVQSMKAIDSLRREFKSVLRDIRLVDNKMTNYNTYSYDDHVIRAVICYGLYPNVCSIAHKETSLSLKTMEDGEVSLHSNTVNARVAKIPYPWLVFNEKIKVNSVYLRDSTAVSDSMLLLFGGSISAGDVDGHLKMLEGYLEFFMAPEVALMYQTLKRELDELFQSKLVNPRVSLHGHHYLLSAIQLLLSRDQCSGRFVYNHEVRGTNLITSHVSPPPPPPPPPPVSEIQSGPGGDNSKNQLQTLLARAGYSNPIYRTNLSNNQFIAICEFNGMQFMGRPCNNKKQAEKDAAGEALDWLLGGNRGAYELINSLSMMMKSNKNHN
ncbi:RNA helicase HrpA [Artemisia annua]|uniref:RNA helicase n=1 Tax=Artemisia annua TaxID=35608 RepID=A0A2U1MG67_ARTAN|nr:RNA helicase HrpA [Artemisia annua]